MIPKFLPSGKECRGRTERGWRVDMVKYVEEVYFGEERGPAVIGVATAETSSQPNPCAVDPPPSRVEMAREMPY